MSRFQTASAPIRRCAAVGAALILAGCASARPAAPAGPALWRVTGPQAQVDLFGSIHLLSNATQWKTPELLAELAKADAVWFEIPLGADSHANAVRLIQAKGLLPLGQTLGALLPPALSKRVATLAVREGLDPVALQHMRPWLAELELTVVFYQRQGYREDLGVENQINLAAPPTARRDAFETLDEQVSIFADEPVKEQVSSLKETLDEIDTDPGLFARAADAWRRGDVTALAREIVYPTSRDDAALYRRVFVERNRRFAARIEQIARTGRGQVFVVVGAGHLVGRDGVPTLLRRDGFKVQGP